MHSSVPPNRGSLNSQWKPSRFRVRLLRCFARRKRAPTVATFEPDVVSIVAGHQLDPITMKRNGLRHSGGVLEASTATSATADVLARNGQAAAVDPEALRQRVSRVIFVSLLIDLLAFTMILPLLPSLLDYYRQNDEGGLFPYLERKIIYFQTLVGAPDSFNTVLFGGLIGSMYSLLQFVVSPLIGALSDVYGRRPLLLLCMSGEAVAYLVWALSSNFSIFVLARILGGISNGNVSLSTAIMTDVSSIQTRGKGMALIGIAFSIGFIVGPITGALFSIWAKTQTGQFFVVPALLALILALVNVFYLYSHFPETLPKAKRAKSLGNGISKAYNLICPSQLFGFNAVEGVPKEDKRSLQQLGQVYFLYLLMYSGLEYTLTFLTHIKFGYTSMQQGKMFLFIGLIMACVQGGYVRRIPAGREKSTALRGISLIIPSFIIVGLASNAYVVFLGLALYAFASASVVPCLTTLASSFGSYDQKGKVMGIYRSLGALARSIGPITASVAYWSLGPSISYILGGALLLLPYLLLRRIPK